MKKCPICNSPYLKFIEAERTKGETLRRIKRKARERFGIKLGLWDLREHFLYHVKPTQNLNSLKQEIRNRTKVNQVKVKP